MASVASEPYKKVGRGGAGNFYSKKDVEDVQGRGKASDIEAQLPTTLPRDLTAASQPAPEYQHTGRGGAGNYIQPSELASQGLSQGSKAVENPTAEAPSSSLPTATSISSPRQQPSSTPRYRGGRGGAGNYSMPEDEEVLRKERLEQQRAVEERIRRDVENGLARPERAYGGLGAAWELESMDFGGRAAEGRAGRR